MALSSNGWSQRLEGVGRTGGGGWGAVARCRSGAYDMTGAVDLLSRALLAHFVFSHVLCSTFPATAAMTPPSSPSDNSTTSSATLTGVGPALQPLAASAIGQSPPEACLQPDATHAGPPPPPLPSIPSASASDREVQGPVQLEGAAVQSGLAG